MCLSPLSDHLAHFQGRKREKLCSFSSSSPSKTPQPQPSDHIFTHRRFTATTSTHRQNNRKPLSPLKFAYPPSTASSQCHRDLFSNNTSTTYFRRDASPFLHFCHCFRSAHSSTPPRWSKSLKLLCDSTWLQWKSRRQYEDVCCSFG